MSTFQDVLDDIALVVGGAQVTAPPPGLYNGAGAAVAGLTGGCYSRPPASPQSFPVGIVVPRSFTAKLMQQGYEENEDVINLIILIGGLDPATDLALLNPFRDTVPAAFRAHMQLDQVAGATALTPEPLYAFVDGGRAGAIQWAGTAWWGWKFDIRLLRTPMVVYAP